MKRLWIAAILLCALLGATLANAWYLGRLTGELTAALEESEALAEAGDWAGAQAATEAGQEAIGRDIPMSGADIYPDFEITRVQVADFKAGGESGSFTVRIMAKAKRDLPLCKLGYKPGEGEYSLQETRFYYALIRSDDHLIELGQVNPFSSKPYMGQPAAEYESGQTIPAGSLCNSQGAPIAINCHTYDFTDFAKIVFLPEKDYQSMRRQAYGF